MMIQNLKGDWYVPRLVVPYGEEGKIELAKCIVDITQL